MFKVIYFKIIYSNVYVYYLSLKYCVFFIRCEISLWKKERHFQTYNGVVRLPTVNYKYDKHVDMCIENISYIFLPSNIQYCLVYFFAAL